MVVEFDLECNFVFLDSCKCFFCFVEIEIDGFFIKNMFFCFGCFFYYLCMYGCW